MHCAPVVSVCIICIQASAIVSHESTDSLCDICIVTCVCNQAMDVLLRPTSIQTSPAELDLAQPNPFHYVLIKLACSSSAQMHGITCTRAHMLR